MKLKIAIVVQGRFHAFDLARALLQRGHDVAVFTNYPKWAVKRFDFPESRVRSCWRHGVLTRAAAKLERFGLTFDTEAWLNTMFSRWAAKELLKEHWDVVHPWSGVSEEILQALEGKSTLRLLMRGSAHISTQAKLLEEEENRTGSPQDRPSPWIISRELREYEMADKILALSSFARDSFIANGLSPQKVPLLPLGASLEMFRPSPRAIEERCRRILSGQPLRVLFVGTVSFRKGLHDMASIVKQLKGQSPDDKKFCFRFVGPVASEAASMETELSGLAEFIPKQPQAELVNWYSWGDVFIFPTIEDGYAVVLAQASFSGLPVLTTTNSGGPDLIKNNETGWILPIRSPQLFVERLLWCESHREELASMARRIYNDFEPRDWGGVAADFETICVNSLEHGNGRQKGANNGR
ncbi:MAG TPA: glycosyltransferase family 4 protein [Blastocatellia bacterium]|nr:glycosyltransferase family 4 protein [Blastocatellia bacterium]